MLLSPGQGADQDRGGAVQEPGFSCQPPARDVGGPDGETGQGEHGEGGPAAAGGSCECLGTDQSFILTNIARLITPSGRTKSAFLSDLAEQKNAAWVAVTETWLHDGVKDAEVCHDFSDFTLFRADRAEGREGGGVALYLRDELAGDLLATYYNDLL